MSTKFSVDTHLFRELGEMLVGRDSTALIELIKNAYDADATLVRVIGSRLESGQPGVIEIQDDGTGMTPADFEKGFLRVASRLKEVGSRRSKKYGRRFTGAKGVGRLAAHKLASVLNVESVPDRAVWAQSRGSNPSENPFRSVVATIDWNKVEDHETLDTIDGPPALSVKANPVDNKLSGTTLKLKGIRRPWTTRELSRFVREVQSFGTPPFLVDSIPTTALTAPLLFDKPSVRDVTGSNGDPGFEVLLEGDFDTGDDFWQHLVERMEWVIEIDARSVPGKVLYAIAPTARTHKDNPFARQRRFEEDRTTGTPLFHARIFIGSGKAMKGLPSGSARWVRDQSGVRVYMEGFRVLPYGDSGNDWLDIDRDYAGRTASSLPTFSANRFENDFDEQAPLGRAALTMLPARSYYGGVFLTQEDAPALQMLVNREGFLPNRSFDAVQSIIRAGIDLSVRVRAAAAQSKTEAEEERNDVGRKQSLARGEDDTATASHSAGDARKSSPPRRSGPASPRLQLDNQLNLVQGSIQRARAAAAAGNIDGVESAIAEIESVQADIRHRLADARDEQALLRTIASVGTQMASFAHELNGLIETSRLLSGVVDELASDESVPSEARRKLRKVRDTFLSIRQSLDRFASYLIDVVSPDARRRRSRQRLAERVDAAWRLVQPRASEQGITLTNEVEDDHRTPPMFPAEITSVLLNLMTNAIKAAGDNGRIITRSESHSEGSVVFTMENTGDAVDLTESEVWFRPFESTTAQADPVLGTGMGLGLPIVRRILEEVGARVRFVSPTSSPFTTAVEITFPAS